MINELYLRMDESPESGVKRIAAGLLKEAREALHDPVNTDAAVHGARKAFKQFRSLLRLVREGLAPEHFQQANEGIRAAGRLISPLRDSQVLIDTVEDLWEEYYDFFAEEVFWGIRSRLKGRHQKLSRRLLEKDKILEEVLLRVMELERPIRSWHLDAVDFEAYSDGLQKVYGAGRKLMNTSWKDPRPEELHEWRKKVKQLYYQCGFLMEIWPDMMGVYESSLGELQELLGKDHDLALLSLTFDLDPKLCPDPKRKHILQHLIMQERRALQGKFWPLGYQLYHEQPALFVQRLRSFYEARKMEME